MNVKPFLTAEWRDLVMANYIIDPAVLYAYVPPKTELDFYNGRCYVSLVGFMFTEVRVKGVSIPLHTKFPEVNLRFYVRYKEDNAWKRGVVFIKEIVPKRMISFVANTFFGERYTTMPMMHNRKTEGEKLNVSYGWKKGVWNSLEVTAGTNKKAFAENSEEEFITQHFWGYTSPGKQRTGEYHVTHPAWEIYPVINYRIKCDFGKLYGDEFGFLANHEPGSVFMADGSPITVYNKKFI